SPRSRSGASGSRNPTFRCTGPGRSPSPPRAAPQARSTRARCAACVPAYDPGHGAGRSCSHRVAPAKRPGCTVVWLAPVPRSSSGRSADSTMSGTAPWCASSTAGCRLATAVPEVVITTAGRRLTFASPRARKPADRSSTRTCRRRRPARSACCTAYASGAERDPGARTTSRTPHRTSSSTSTVARAVEGFTRDRSEDPDAVLRCQPHAVTLGHPERLVEGVDVAGQVGPQVLGRVRVDRQQPLGLLGSRLAPPDLPVTEEEPLVAGPAVEHRRCAAGRQPVGLQRDRQPAQVTDVLTDRQPAVDGRARGVARLQL